MLEQPSKRDAQRGLLEALKKLGLTEHGSVIDASMVHEALGIHHPKMASKAVYDRLAMQELSAIDYCRSALLNEGKYLQGTQTGYRILLPSENKGQIDAYMGSADRKLARALKLSRHTPSAAMHSQDQTEARIVMKQGSHRRYHHQQPEMRI